MKKVAIGKIVGTHGIKGEIRILSNFDLKEKVFVPGFKLYFDNEEFIITRYRHHKKYEMVTLEGFNNINEVLKYKGMIVYVNRNDLNLESRDYLLSDLVGMNVLENEILIGKVENIVYNNANILLEIASEKNFYIPVNDNFIENVSLENNEIKVKNIKGLML